MEKIFKLCVVATVVYVDMMEAFVKSILGKKAEIVEHLSALRKEFEEALESSKLMEVSQEQVKRLGAYNEAFEALVKDAKSALGLQEKGASQLLFEKEKELEELENQVIELGKDLKDLRREVKREAEQAA